MCFQKIFIAVFCLWSAVAFGAAVPTGTNLLTGDDSTFEGGIGHWTGFRQIAGGYEGKGASLQNNMLSGSIYVSWLEADANYRVSFKVSATANNAGFQYLVADFNGNQMASGTGAGNTSWGDFTVDVSGNNGGGYYIQLSKNNNSYDLKIDNASILKLSDSGSNDVSVNMWGIMSLFFGIATAMAFIYGVSVLT
jgi:hypothetical protein